MFLKKIDTKLISPLDMCAVFSNRNMVASFLVELAKDVIDETVKAKEEGRVPPAFFYADSDCYAIDYRIFLKALTWWLEWKCGGSREEIVRHIKRMYLPSKNANDFSRKLLINFLFGEIYKVVNLIDPTRKYIDSPYYTPAVCKAENGIYGEILGIFFRRQKLSDMLGITRAKLLENLDRCVIESGSEPVAIGASAVSKFWSGKEKAHAFKY